MTEKSNEYRNKDQDQISAIREVQKATEAAMKEVISYLRSAEKPVSEKAHQIIDDTLRGFGCESPKGHIVAGGEQAAEPHEFGTGPLSANSTIVIDIFPRSKVTGYYADMSRTVCIGASSLELQKMYNAVLGAQELAVSMVRPGVRCARIHEAVEKFFKDKGYVTSGKGKEFKFAEGFVHGLGHGVGLNIHEAPFINKNSEEMLEAGDVITIEPGLYYNNIGGVRLEDLLVVTDTGHENLTDFEKRFVI